MNQTSRDSCQLLSSFAAELSFRDLSDPVVEQTKLFIADFYAACYAGWKINREFNEAALWLLRENGGAEDASVLMEDRKYPVAAAAWMNGAYAHGADMDDGNRKAAGHIGTHVMAAVLALAEKYSAKWENVILAINVGYEFFNRVVGAVQPSLYNKGFHSTGIGGGIACAAACAKLLGLDAARIYNAVSLAAVQSSGLIIIDESGQGCKPINPANAARCGVEAALMASRGIEAPRYPLESRKGWFNAFSDQVDDRVLLEDLGKKFTICDSYLKLYPSCRHTHCCIDGILQIREMLEKEGCLAWEQVSDIQIWVYPSAIKSTGTICWPKTSQEAKFSMCYTVALALYSGTLTLEQLEPVQEPAVRTLTEKITLIPAPEMENRELGIRGARLRLRLQDGTQYAVRVDLPKGEGASVLSWEDMRHKLHGCADGILTREEMDALLCHCRELDPGKQMDPLLSRSL